MQPCGGQLACLFADEPAFRAHVCEYLEGSDSSLG